MALKVVFQLVDDLDGSTSEDVERVSFGLDGARYEIDLTATNAGQLRRLMARYVEAARCTGRTQAPPLTLAQLRPVASRSRTAPLVDQSGQNVEPLMCPPDRKSA